MKNVLLVDDDHSCLTVLGSLILERVGIAPSCAMSGEEALKAIQEKQFDLIITDFNMPGMNGLELVERVQETALNIPLILNSGALSPEIIQRAKNCGVAGVLEKPFKLEAMVSMIKSALNVENTTIVCQCG